MPVFDPRDLLQRVVQPEKEPTTFQPTIHGVDVRRPGALAVSLLRKALRDQVTVPAVVPEEMPVVTEVPLDVPLPPVDQESGKPEKKEKEKTGTDQAPPIPRPPGPLRVKGPKKPEIPKIEGGAQIEVSEAFDADKPFRDKRGKTEFPAAMDVKKQDVQLWKAYKSQPSGDTLRPLMTAMEPLMHSEVNRWKASAPQPVLFREAKAHTLHAINTYDPNQGAALGTHVMNRLKKLSRVSYQNQDLVRLPENKKLKSQALYNATEELRNRHGRDPTNDELADQLGWSPRRVSDVQRATVGEYIESQDVGGDMFSDVYGRDIDDPVIDFLYYDMSPLDKQIFEHLTGYTGKPTMSMSALAAKLGITESQVRSRKAHLIKKIKQAR